MYKILSPPLFLIIINSGGGSGVEWGGEEGVGVEERTGKKEREREGAVWIVSIVISFLQC